ncbi:aminotransferase class I/II-fold pyridoxal phosphate-dependent enzyme [Microbacterium murale]|uniref:GntR family transcriptional regulator n=1 Tax=Microbacterium murale TaxID=1081040 RepID=A0ABQ1R8Y0_9MICO|nr:aminotransferase class I/II-fold pyridoxal phosphate-dependent enzyme [Microbacterium murale]GGD62556.1 GntR family transcriptional regulator [Microbacterium murale]
MLADDLPTLVSSSAIAKAFSAAIASGELAVGTALPSIRSLSEEIGVSPGTVALAFRLLRERGVITSAHGKRSRVAERPPIPRPFRLPLPDDVRDLSTSSPDPALLPDVGSFLSPDLYAPRLYNTPALDDALVPIMSAQFAADGIDGQLTVVNGALDGMERILATHLRPGDAVIVEDPQWVSSLSLFRVLGLTVVPVPVDDEGMIPSALAEALGSRRSAALILTPRAQNPYGSALSPERAERLRAVIAKTPELIVIEDDHASLIAGAPASTLATGRQKWAVIRSMSKALGPDLRIAVMSSDAETADRVEGRLLLGPGWVSHLTQRLVAAVLSDEQAVAQIATAERVYTERRSAFAGALADRGIPSVGRSGMNVLIPVAEESTLAGFLLTRGWAVRTGEPFRLHTPPFIRVTTAALKPEDGVRLADDLRFALGGERYRPA